ncbi:MAG: hypothetical protein K940chlam7_01727 [Chlamydiae bacterium]|nr:hypothetical protein [Chlamydiota bacterium]
MKAAVILSVLLTFSLPSILTGMASDQKSACILPKGQTLLSGTYWSYSADKFWNSSGKKCSAYNEFDKFEYTFYLEYGLTCRDGISAKGTWGKIDESINGKTFGFGDVEIAWKHCLGTKWRHLVSMELLGIIPVEDKHKPGLRYGKYGGEVSLLASRGFCLWERKGSYDLRLGYRNYEGYPSDQIRADGQLNFFPFSRLQISASGHLEYGLFNGNSRTDQSLFLLSPNYRLFRGQIEAVLCIWKGLSAFAGYHQHLWGRNVGTNGGFYGGARAQF